MQVLNKDNDAVHSMTRKQRNIRKVLVKIAQELNQLPSSLRVHGMQLQEPEPVEYGGYADVFLGNLAGAEVALKRFRLHSRGAGGSVRKVSSLSQA
jgi:hypothetical protein